MGQYQLIRASAGSGKTYGLSGHFLRQLFLNNPPESILATTFTRKAAGEILGRVLTRLAKGAESPAEATKLGQALDIADLTMERAQQQLASLTRNLHRLRVCTLDSYFQQAARSMTLELGLTPGWSILDQHLDEDLREQAIDAVLSQQLPEDAQNLMHMLAKGHSKRSVRVLIHDTVMNFHELFQQTSPEAWEQIPSGRRLTEEQRQELLQALRTAELPADRRAAAARDKDIQRFEGEQWSDFMLMGLATKVFSDDCRYYNKELSASLCAIYRKLLEHAGAEMLQQWSQQMKATYDLMTRFDQEYAKLRADQGWMRFGDVTRVLARSAEASGDRLNFRLDSSLRNLLLDEFQDTSADQWTILKRLTESIVSQGSRGSIFCVGDGKQAIYGWRGGVAEILDAVAMAVPGIEERPLNQSRRSAPAIMETVNRVFKNLDRHGALNDFQDACHAWSARFPEHSTVHTELPGRVEFRTSPLWEGESADERRGPWYRWLAEQIRDQHLRTPGAIIGVLTRGNAPVARLVYELTLLGVPASEEGGTPPTDSPAVLAVMSALQLASHPASTVSRYHVYSSPLGSVIGLTNWEDNTLAAEVSESLRRQLLEDGYGQTLQKWARAVDADCSSRDRLRLSQIASEGWAFDELGSLDPCEFIRLLEVSRFQKSEPAPVRVMTVHQSKGLEFDIVVLPELDTPLFRHPSAAVTGPAPAAPPDRVCVWMNQDLRRLLPASLQQAFTDTMARGVAENLCVFYVAMTRARHALLLLSQPLKSRSLPATWGGILLATLTDKRQADESELLFETGDPEWSRNIPHFSTAAILHRRTAEVPKIRLAPPLAVRERGLPRRSPSKHDHVPEAVRPQAATTRRSSAKRPVTSERRIDPRLRGIMFHAAFETVEWLLPEEKPDQAVLMQLLQKQVGEQELSNAELQQLIEQFLTALDVPAVRRIFDRNQLGGSPVLAPWCDAVRAGRATVSVHRERTFARIHEGALVQGTIDRLVLVRESGKVVAADVVDFKTDQLSGDPDEWQQQKVAFYAPQLHDYAAAVRYLTAVPELDVSTRLLLIEGRCTADVRSGQRKP
jgi:ATP-dependent exoDNAse (exonuclease V) beta subunit